MVATRLSATKRRIGIGAGLSDLNDDLIYHIFAYQDARTLWCLLQTNQRLHRIATEDGLWRALLLAQLGDASLMPSASRLRGTWKGRFLRWQALSSCTSFMPNRLLLTGSCPPARFLHRATCLDQRLYIFGGTNGDYPEFNDLWVLDLQHSALTRPDAHAPITAPTSASAWTRVHPRTPPPPQRQSATLTAVGSQILMFAGRRGDTTFLNDAWTFDALEGTWTCVRESDEVPLLAQASLDNPVRPSPRWAHTAVAFGSSVLVFGGSAPGTCFGDLHWFDLESLAWRRQLCADGHGPAARSGHSACSACGGSTMFLFGGNTTKASFDDLWEFGVASASWRKVRARGVRPSARVGHTLCAVGSRLLVLGGREYTTNIFDPQLHAFSLATRRWNEVPVCDKLPDSHTRAPDFITGPPSDTTARSPAQAPTADWADGIEAVMGTPVTPPLGAAVERAGGSAQAKKQVLVRTGHCAALHRGRLLLFGGLDDRSRMLDDLVSVELIA